MLYLMAFGQNFAGDLRVSMEVFRRGFGRFSSEKWWFSMANLGGFNVGDEGSAGGGNRSSHGCCFRQVKGRRWWL